MLLFEQFNRRNDAASGATDARFRAAGFDAKHTVITFKYKITDIHAFTGPQGIQHGGNKLAATERIG